MEGTSSPEFRLAACGVRPHPWSIASNQARTYAAWLHGISCGWGGKGGGQRYQTSLETACA
eukprot:6197851-Pleurochrysis_carterae.AAC.1